MLYCIVVLYALHTLLLTYVLNSHTWFTFSQRFCCCMYISENVAFLEAYFYEMCVYHYYCNFMAASVLLLTTEFYLFPINWEYLLSSTIKHTIWYIAQSYIRQQKGYRGPWKLSVLGECFKDMKCIVHDLEVMFTYEYLLVKICYFVWPMLHLWKSF